MSAQLRSTRRALTRMLFLLFMAGVFIGMALGIVAGLNLRAS